MMSRKSSFIPRSWISSTTTWLTPSSSGSLTSLRSRTPVVQKSSRVPSLRRFSRRIWYPTESPTLSPRSAATRCETDTAEIRRGCVQMMLHRAPRPASISLSRMNCGSWVVFPHPVSPLITRTCAGKGAFVSSSHAAGGGARFRAGSPRRPGRPSWPSPHLVLPDHSQQLLPLAVRRELAAEGQHLLRLPAAARLLLPRLELLALRLVHGRVLREVSAPSSATHSNASSAASVDEAAREVSWQRLGEWGGRRVARGLEAPARRGTDLAGGRHSPRPPCRPSASGGACGPLRGARRASPARGAGAAPGPSRRAGPSGARPGRPPRSAAAGSSSPARTPARGCRGPRGSWAAAACSRPAPCSGPSRTSWRAGRAAPLCPG